MSSIVLLALLAMQPAASVPVQAALQAGLQADTLVNKHADTLVNKQADALVADSWAVAAPPDKAAIRAAVGQVLQAEVLAINPRRYEADTRHGDRYDTFAIAFAYARVPDCLRPNGLKHQPTYIFSGLLALPFVAIAKAKGRCN